MRRQQEAEEAASAGELLDGRRELEEQEAEATAAAGARSSDRSRLASSCRPGSMPSSRSGCRLEQDETDYGGAGPGQVPGARG